MSCGCIWDKLTIVRLRFLMLHYCFLISLTYGRVIYHLNITFCCIGEYDFMQLPLSYVLMIPASSVVRAIEIYWLVYNEIMETSVLKYNYILSNYVLSNHS